jgi:hypothetical protein
MNPWLTIVHLCLPIAAALICFYYAFNFLKSARSLQDLPVSKIRSAAQGFVELNGYAAPLPDSVITGKLTATPCAWYCYQVEEYDPDLNEQTDLKPGWQVIDKEISNAPFLFRDDTGECVIFPRNAEVLSTKKISFRGHSRAPGLQPTTWWQRLWSNNGRYRYTESRLELYKPLAVTGMFYSYNPKYPPPNDENLELSTYLNETNIQQVNVLLRNGLQKDQCYILSALSTNMIIFRYQLKSGLFFIAFLFFVIITTSQTFSLAKGTLNTIQTQQLINKIIRAFR